MENELGKLLTENKLKRAETRANEAERERYKIKDEKFKLEKECLREIEKRNKISLRVGICGFIPIGVGVGELVLCSIVDNQSCTLPILSLAGGIIIAGAGCVLQHIYVHHTTSDAIKQALQKRKELKHKLNIDL